MADRPILFSGPMVRAILDGQKTMTRRVVKPQPPAWCEDTGAVVSMLTPPGHWEFRGNYGDEGPASKFIRCPYLPVSETRLWVREAFSAWFQGIHWYSYKGIRDDVAASNVFYRATHSYPDDDQKWIPSIHMPRWASRITLALKSIRAERLQAIDNIDAKEEGFVDSGIHKEGYGLALDMFRTTWNHLNAKRGFSWDANPWVWVVRFKRVEEV